MQLKNFESAWKQLKLMNTLDQIESRELLAIIDNSENVNSGRLQRVVINMIVFVVLTIVCQSG